MKDFRDLKVWERGHKLTLEIYKITSGFPREEMYGLTSQIRRSCAFIPSCNELRLLSQYIDDKLRTSLLHPVMKRKNCS
jgi:hypothetical protein